MPPDFDQIFDTLTVPGNAEAGRPLFAVAPVPARSRYFIGKDNEGRACILISVTDPERRRHAPIRLESLEVQFEVPSILRVARRSAEGTYTVVRCRSLEPEFSRYFLSVCETIVRILGDEPTATAVANAVNRLALIFQRLQNPPIRPVYGLFGELSLIRLSHSPARALAAWRIETLSRFDFTAGDARLDVKATSGRVRSHKFSYDQCHPPPGSVAVVASFFIERLSAGLAMRDLVDEVERLAGGDTELVMKLHVIVADTLGTALNDSLSIRFDDRLADSSLKFYDLADIPAIRGGLPPGVSDVHFRSDLSALTPVSFETIIQRAPPFEDLLPARP
jgi:hypothetical protein